MRVLKQSLLVILGLILWTVFIGYGLFGGFLLQPITSDNTPTGFIEATKDKISSEYVGNLAMLLIEDGKVSEDYYYSDGQPVSSESLFPVASISKWVTSFGLMKLLEQGKIDLDIPVEDYLTRWKLPASAFDHKQVTVRRLLSHSSGLIDDLGYSGFALDEEIQTLEASLTKASDAPYSDGVAKVGYEPGSQYMYSGGGYTLLQLLIEEISGQSFQAYMDSAVLQPLNMHASTFTLTQQNASDLVPIYKNDGSTRPPRKFTAKAAAALMTTTKDLGHFLLANISENPVLSSGTIELMAEPQTFIGNTPVYGIGPHLYSQGDPGSYIIGHDGSGNNALNTAARIDLVSKSGIIILETGNYNLASSMADEWMFMKAGIADYVVITRNKPLLIKLLIVGYAVVIGLSIYLIRRSKQRRAQAAA